ncbi:hypothetical protein DAEQUDRAFT_360010 [Daedalea quercina L-15889]|uniref:Uncharacterized protein n=1 Tax=Daedalea quercina L-15889 TaxID=1314783 RepID=A0A165TSV5_9APHY|nr:hypothetical protein DAEQUDRAFT_360010 [Daedalea quercina L-15889]
MWRRDKHRTCWGGSLWMARHVQCGAGTADNPPHSPQHGVLHAGLAVLGVTLPAGFAVSPKESGHGRNARQITQGSTGGTESISSSEVCVHGVICYLDIDLNVEY